MELEKLFNQQFLYDLSFFNFENAITATYFADADLNIIKVNKNFKSLFNDDVVLEGQNLLTLLGLLDVAQSHISEFKQKLNKDGKLLIHKIKIIVEYKEHTNHKNIENSLNLLKKFSQSWPKHEKPEKWIVKNKNTIKEKINYKFKK